MCNASPMWSLAEHGRGRSKEETFAEMEGVEKSILLGFADDVIVSVRDSWVDLTVRKKFCPPMQKQMPNFIGLSHVCFFVDDMMEAVSYYIYGNTMRGMYRRLKFSARCGISISSINTVFSGNLSKATAISETKIEGRAVSFPEPAPR